MLITAIINSQGIVVRECELGGGSAVGTAREKNRYQPQFPRPSRSNEASAVIAGVLAAGACVVTMSTVTDEVDSHVCRQVVDCATGMVEVIMQGIEHCCVCLVGLIEFVVATTQFHDVGTAGVRCPRDIFEPPDVAVTSAEIPC